MSSLIVKLAATVIAIPFMACKTTMSQATSATVAGVPQGLSGAPANPFLSLSIEPGPEFASLNIFSLEKIFGTGGCVAKNASDTAKCLKAALVNSSIISTLQAQKIRGDKVDFCEMTEGAVPGGLIAYRFEQMEHGICVSDSLVSVFVDDANFTIVSVYFKISAVEGAPLIPILTRDQAVNVAKKAAQNESNIAGLEFVTALQTVAGTQNPALAYFLKDGKKWFLAEDIEVNSKTFCDSGSLNQEKCKRYRIFVDSMTGDLLQLASLLDAH